MAILSQYNQKAEDNSTNSVNYIKHLYETVNSNNILTPIRIPSPIDVGTTDSNSGITLLDEGLKVNFNLSKGESYYFHGRIRRLSSTQNIEVKLLNSETMLESSREEQYIKTLVVQPGEKVFKTDENGENGVYYSSWADVEFIFTPSDTNYNVIAFELNRNASDLATLVIKENGVTTQRSQMRYTMIIYDELSIVQNLLKTKIGINSLLKIGVQSHPGLIMCINNEEIHVGRTGIYELYNGAINIDFFSVVMKSSYGDSSIILPAQISTGENEEDRDLIGPSSIIGQTYQSLEDLQDALDRFYEDTYSSNDRYELLAEENFPISVSCAECSGKVRTIEPFTLDYMYA